MKIAVLLVLTVFVSASLLTSDSPRLKSYPDENTEGAAFQAKEDFKKQLLGDSPTDNDVELLGYKGKAGMIPVSSTGSSMFYWEIDAKGANIEGDQLPLILWLQGGPGCSSQGGNWFEFGPYYADEQGNPQLRNVTWAENFHLLFIDNPIGAGYSFAASEDEMVTTETEMATNLYNMLQSLATQYPHWFQKRQFYIFGESYGGHYVPVIAYKILTENGRAWITGNAKIPLEGIGIGDGWSDPYNQLGDYYGWGYSVGLLSDKEADVVKAAEKEARSNMYWGDYLPARDNFDTITNTLVSAGGNVNVYNYREFGAYNTTAYESYLNLASTKKMLHVPEHAYYKDCNTDAYNALGEDFMKSIKTYMISVLKQIRVLLYNGQDDLIVNTPGAENWIANLDWYGRKEYLAANKTIWHENDQVVGYTRTYGNLRQVNVNKAGHMAPRDQPANILAMVNKFIEQEDFN